MAIKVKYNIKLQGIRDVTPETLVDISGKTQSDHNRDNDIARNQLSNARNTIRDNQAKLSEVEKLSIKQQLEIDSLKNTPTNFDLAVTERFVDKIGTLAPVALDNKPNANILENVFSPRQDGNFEQGILKNPRAKYIGGVEDIVNIRNLFGTNIADIHFGKTTGSLWIVTSDGEGERGYLYRCSPYFINGNLQIKAVWTITEPAFNKKFTSIVESNYNGVVSLYLGVSDFGGSGHYLNRYELDYDAANDVITIADGKEISSGVAKYKEPGEILDGEVSSSIVGLNVEKIDITESGELRGAEVVNNKIYLLFSNDLSDSEEEVDNPGYSFIRTITITELGTLTSGINTTKIFLDDIFEDRENEDRSGASDNVWDVYGITAIPAEDSNYFDSLEQDDIDDYYANLSLANIFYISAQNRKTNRKQIVEINLANTNNPDASDDGLQNINTVYRRIEGYSKLETNPYIAINLNNEIVEVVENSNNKLFALHSISGFDNFQGNIKYQANVKRYFPSNNQHGQLSLPVSAIAVNEKQAITIGPDISFSFFASTQRDRITSVYDTDIFNYHTYLNGEPFWAKPLTTFAMQNVSGTISSTLVGSVTSGETLMVGHYDAGSSSYKLSSSDFNTIIDNAIPPANGVDGSSNYYIATPSDVTPSTDNIGDFNGLVTYDPIADKTWVGTTYGFIHQIDNAGGGSLTYEEGKTFKVIKLYGDRNSLITSGTIDGSEISAITAYDDKVYVAQYTPNALGEVENTVVRVFDMVRSTSSQPFATDIFTTAGLVRDMSICDTGLFVTKLIQDNISGTLSNSDNSSIIHSVYTKQFDSDVFESTELVDEFNFFRNPVNLGLTSGDVVPLGFNVTASTYVQRERDANEYVFKEWILPRSAVAFGLYTTSANATERGKLQILDYSDVDNPLSWGEFSISNTSSTNPAETGVSGAVLHGSGQITALTSIDDKIFVGRESSGYGTSINVIDFANNNANIIVDSVTGDGSLYTGMQFGYRFDQEDRTGNLGERNNSEYHYSGIVNSEVKVGDGIITSMDSAYVQDNVDPSVEIPYVIVGRKNGTSGNLDIINANTLESVINIGGTSIGNVEAVAINEDGSAFAAANDLTNSGETTIWKINNVKTVDQDASIFIEDFSASRVNPHYSDQARATYLTDMKVDNRLTVDGRRQNIIYATFAGSGDVTNGDIDTRTMAVKFDYETVASAGGAVSSPTEFTNNAEVIYNDSSTENDKKINSIDYMDDRVFLGFTDDDNDFRLSIVKKFPIVPDTSLAGFANNWAPILGSYGIIDKYVDYNDLNYNGVKAPITNINVVSDLSLVFANTENGSLLMKFPHVISSTWTSKIKPIKSNTNAVALSRDVFVENGVVTEFVERNDERLRFEGNWTEESPGQVIDYTSPLFNKPVGKKQVGGKLLKNDGTPYEVTSFNKYDAFTSAEENNLTLLWDGSDVSNFGYDFKENVLMIQKDEPIEILDFVESTLTETKFKPFYKEKKFSIISLNDNNTAVSFFETASGEITNNADNQFGSLELNLDVSQRPVISVTAFGKQLATFQNADGTINDTLEESQVALPALQVLTTGRNKRGVKKLRIVTFNKKIQESVFPSLQGKIFSLDDEPTL